MLFHQRMDAGQLGGCKTTIGGQRDGAQPKLGFHVLARDMNVRRLVAFAALKVKSVWANTHHGRHDLESG